MTDPHCPPLGEVCYAAYAAYAAYLQGHGYVTGGWPLYVELGPIQQAGYEAAAAAVLAAAKAREETPDG